MDLGRTTRLHGAAEIKRANHQHDSTFFSPLSQKATSWMSFYSQKTEGNKSGAAFRLIPGLKGGKPSDQSVQNV